MKAALLVTAAALAGVAIIMFGALYVNDAPRRQAFEICMERAKASYDADLSDLYQKYLNKQETWDEIMESQKPKPAFDADKAETFRCTRVAAVVASGRQP